MALTHISVRIANPARPKRLAHVKFLVDSGAIYSVVPARTLDRLGVKPHSRRTFVLADGSEVSRRMGDALFRLNGRQGASPVMFGEKGDSVLLGAVTLESLGVLLDPLRRELRPLPMVLAPRIPG
ncbi:MAG TPA: aspartyl protease family protein [Vicinamibacteria bacterium]|jgi:clan AA aspartic protease